MPAESNLQDSHAIAKKVVSKAALSKLELVPEVYGVWYAYFDGKHPKLNEELDIAVSSGKQLDTKIHKEIFSKHLQPEDDSQAAQQVVNETHLILKGVLDEMLDANSATADYGKNLQAYAGELGQAKKVSDVKAIITSLLQETSAAAASGQALQEKLAQATEKTQQLEEKLATVEEEATVDALTGLRNRKAFDAKFKELFDEFRRRGAYFSAIMVDIDFFKKFNDTYGHQTGDLVLQVVGDTLHRSLKGDDFPARYGGEEFVVLLPETSLENAIVVAEQLRVRISMKKIEDERHPDTVLKVNASLGVSFINKEDTMQKVLERADKALYLAKEAGRNQVKSERDLP